MSKDGRKKTKGAAEKTAAPGAVRTKNAPKKAKKKPEKQAASKRSTRRPAAKDARKDSRARGAAPPAKRYLKTRSICKVTFRLPAQAAPHSQVVSLVGDFNGWNDGTPMRRLKDGSYTCTLDLEAGREYRFRYLIDDCRWENDWCADRYEPNAFGAEDSVIDLRRP